jgi:hypothetical protein
MIRPFIALKDTRTAIRPYAGVRAVKLVTVQIPVRGAMPGVVLMDPPASTRPATRPAATPRRPSPNEVDVTIFVKDVTRPSLVQQRDRAPAHDAARRPQHLPQGPDVRRADEGRPLRSPGRKRQLALAARARNFKDQGVDRVFPYSKMWVAQGRGHVAPGRAAGAWTSTTRPSPCRGLEMLQAAISLPLRPTSSARPRKSINVGHHGVSRAGGPAPGRARGVKDEAQRAGVRAPRRAGVRRAVRAHPAGRRRPGRPAARDPRNLSRFMDHELSEEQRLARASPRRRAHQADPEDLLARLTPEEAERKRRQMPEPRPHERDRRRDRDAQADARARAARIAGSARTSATPRARASSGCSTRCSCEASYAGGRLEVLLPPARVPRRAHRRARPLRPRERERRALPEQRDGQGRRRLRGALELLRPADRRHPRRDRPRRPRDARARDARARAVLRHGDRRQGRGDPLPATAGNAPPRHRRRCLPSMQAKLGLSGGDEPPRVSGGRAHRVSLPQPRRSPVARSSRAPTPTGGGRPGVPPGPTGAWPRDWSRMLVRVRADVERICDFLEALARHPRGLQKYHEEAVRTVHDSWIDREGEQSLRRWVRSECARIWPHASRPSSQEKAAPAPTSTPSKSSSGGWSRTAASASSTRPPTPASRPRPR